MGKSQRINTIFYSQNKNLKALSDSKIKNVNFLLRHILGKISEWIIFDAHCQCDIESKKFQVNQQKFYFRWFKIKGIDAASHI